MALKVFDLQCEHGHVFEGWFRSDSNYGEQQAQGLLSCPVCSSTEITKQLSAPRLNISHLKQERPASATVDSDERAVAAPSGKDLAQLQAQFIQQLRGAVREADDVGKEFADEARRIRDGEAKERSIRGVASTQELRELHEEGIDVLPIPDILNDEQLH